MKTTTFEIYPRTDSERKKGGVSIYFRLICNRRSTRHHLGVTIPDIKYWDPDKLEVLKNPDTDHNKDNLLIEAAKVKAARIIFDSKLNAEPLTVDLFLSRYYQEPPASKDCFYSFCEKEITYMKNSAQSKETVRTYNSYVSKLKKFRDKIAFSDIQGEFIKDLNTYMVQTLKNEENTREKLFAFIHTMLNRAIKQGLIKTNRLTGNIPAKKRDGKREFLTLKELDKLEILRKKKLPDYLRNVLNYFLFACYTGLRFTDIKNLRFKDIKETGKEKFIYVKMNKTQTLVSIPLNERAVRCLGATGLTEQKVFRAATNQVTNKFLKKLITKAKINKRITFHCARHTFATVSLEFNIPLPVISNILGHTNLKTTMIYTRIIESFKVQEMKKWNFRK